MTRNPLTQARLVALCVLGALLFGFPLVSLFSRELLVWGIPVFFLYAFGVWAVLVALTAVVLEVGEHRPRTPHSPQLPAPPPREL